MAFIDYGAIAFKNKKLISTDMFTPMEETCGFSDKKTEDHFDGNQFVVCGDKDLYMGFYKKFMCWKSNYDDKSDDKIFNPYQDFQKWKYWEKDIYYQENNDENSFEKTRIIIKHKNGYYVARWEYKGDKYKVYFGYGVDFDFYKRTKRVNYYRSPENYLKELKYKIKR